MHSLFTGLWSGDFEMIGFSLNNVCLGVVVSLVCLFSSKFVRAEEENPYKKAKVGDWVEYKMANKVGGFAVNVTQKKTVIAKTDNDVTIEMETNGAKIPITIKLNEKYNSVPQSKDSEVKVVDQGTEKVTVGDKTLDTKWIATEVTVNAGGKTTTTKSNVWMSPDVPLDGMVKMQADMGPSGKSTMELTAFGSK